MGELETLARARQDNDLANPPEGYTWDQDAADYAVAFIETHCRHHKGEWAGQLMVLEEWESDYIIQPIFGWVSTETGLRRYRTAWIEVARKNGKSQIAAAVALLLTLADREPGAEVYSTATKRDQARIVFDTAVEMLRASPELRAIAGKVRNRVFCPQLNSYFEPLSADSETLDGLNPHGNIVDEVHAHKNRKVWDKLETALGARRQPLTFAITTAGEFNPESIGWQLHDYAEKVLRGVFVDNKFFAFIACADPEDDWRDPKTWQKANPNWGISVKPDYLADMAKKAERQPSFLNTFERYHLNRWVQERNRWLNLEQWDACEPDIDPSGQTPEAYRTDHEDPLEGRQCYAGLDLASKIDLTALTLVFPATKGDPRIKVVSRFWLPEGSVLERSRRDMVPYDVWSKQGWLTLTPGDVVDYDFIEEEVYELGRRFRLLELGFDPWNATQTAVHLQGQRVKVVEVRMGFATLTEPCKELERDVVAGELSHGAHPVLRWNAANVMVRTDPNGNLAPDRGASREKIDGIVSTVIAMSRLIVHRGGSSVYERRGVRTV